MNGYDYIIVGSGSAGGFMTLRLSENPDVKILLLEAGVTDKHWTTTIPAGTRYTFNSDHRNWRFKTLPEPHMKNRVLDQPRGKVIGGSSSINGMVFVRGHREDFAEWGAMGVEGWSYDDVLPHYKSIERYSEGGDDFRGDGGPISVEKQKNLHPIEEAFLEAGVEAGHALPADYNGAEQEGVCAFDVNIDKGWRSGTGRECVRPAAKRPNVTVISGAHVTRIRIENGRAVGVDYRQGGRDHTAHADREVVLSAGSIQTPQLLMLSGIGPAGQLREHGIDVLADMPGVGENLQDHLECHLQFHCPHKGMSRNKVAAKHRILLAGIEWYLFKTGNAARGPSCAGAFFKSDPSKAQPDIQFHFWPYFMENWMMDPDKDGYSIDVGPVKSESRGWVRLASSDPFAAPLIQMNGLSREEDFVVFREAVKIARDIESQRAFDFCRGGETVPGISLQSDAQIDDYVREHANSAYHPCGTAKMGAANDKMAVCDNAGKVLGVEGLRIADASIMPRITNGNINAPSMMIGEKIASAVKAGW